MADAPEEKKQGFMTKERKKKLREMLRKKAAEELKREQERKAAERQRTIDERTGTPKDIENISDDALIKIIEEYYNRVNEIEGTKYDVDRIVKIKDMEISELNKAVNAVKGKYMKPPMKKIPKKFGNFDKPAEDLNFQAKLKPIKTKSFEETIDYKEKPDWLLKAKEKAGAGGKKEE